MHGRATKKAPSHQLHVAGELGPVDGLGVVPTHSVFACRGIQTVHRCAPRSTEVRLSARMRRRSMPVRGPATMARPPLGETRAGARRSTSCPPPNPPTPICREDSACTQSRRQRARQHSRTCACVRAGKRHTYIVSMSRTGLGPSPPPSAEPAPPAGPGMRTCVRRPASRRAAERRQLRRLHGAAWRDAFCSRCLALVACCC